MKHSKKKKNDKRWQGGFTLAELLVALGILSILLSIGMVSVTYYQRNLKVTEMDAIAKEIFVSAQNHITASKATVEWEELENQHQSDFEQYFGNRMQTKPSDYPSGESWTEGGNGREHDYHYIIYDGREDTLKNTILDIMLPYGSIDDEVRTNGHYVIEYDYKTATVYGVFYTDNSKKFSYENDIMGSSGLNNQYGRENSARGRETRKNYKNDSGHIIIGYYGGATTTELKSAKLQPLEVEVKNGDTLGVIIRDKNYGNIIEGTKVKTKISFTVTGEESQAVKKTILETNPLGNVQSGETWWTAKEEKNIGVYEVTLDDITKQGGHFADIFPEFIAGENLLIEVEAFSNEVLCTPVKTQVATNSLFEAKYGYEKNGTSFAKVSIGNIRHLQNLNPEVSNLFMDALQGQNGKTVGRIVKVAEQTKSLDWEDFMKEKPSEEKKIYSYHKIAIQQKVLATNQFYGIENTALMEYEGNGHTLSHFSLKENANGNVGLFSQIGTENKKQEMTIKNLVLDSFTSESKTYGGDAGTLVGKVGENGDLLIQDIKSFDSTAKTEGQGNTGLFVGEVTEKGTLTGKDIFGINATVIAKNQGNAGGLVGKMSAGTLLQCGLYLTDDEEESANPKSALEKYEVGAYNQEKNTIGSQFMVLSEGGVSGGLIGLVEKNSIEIADSFVAVPVITKAEQNGASGGLIGRNQAQEITIKNSYVSGYTKAGNYSEFYGVSAVGNGGMAGGLIGQDNAQTTIKNSYSTASVYGSMAGGLIGKIEKGNQTYMDSYTTGKITGSDQNSKTGSFIGDTGGMGKISATNSYALKDSNKSLTTTVQGIQEVDYDGLIKATFSDEFKKTADSKIETYSYDGTLLEEEYPFHLVTKTGEKNSDTEKVHYGDWPLKQKMSEGGDMSEEFDIGFLYYEFLEDKEGNPDDTFYYHGWGGFQSDNEYDTSTYKELFTKGEGLVNGLSREPDTYVREEGYLLLVKSDIDLNGLTIKIDGQGKAAKDYFTKVEMQLPEQFADFLIYRFNSEAEFSTGIPTIIFGEPADQYNPIWGAINNKVGFSINPLFGDAIYLIGQPSNDSTYYVRSARHLANMAKHTAITSWNGAKNKFVQTIDIDLNRHVNGKKEQANTIQTFNATYVSEYYPNSKDSYKIVGLATNLFGTINGTIERMTLKEMNIENPSATVLFAQKNTGNVKELIIQNAVFKNNSSIQGVIGTLEKGTLSNIKVDNIELKTDGNVDVFMNYNNAGTVSGVKVSNVNVKGKGNVNGFINKNEGEVTQVELSQINIETDGAVNVFMNYNNKGIVTDIKVFNVNVKGKGNVNGFIGDNQGEVTQVELSQMTIQSDGAVNGFTPSSIVKIQDVKISGLSIVAQEKVNGFAGTSQSPIVDVILSDITIDTKKDVDIFLNYNNGSMVKNIEMEQVKVIAKGTVAGFINKNEGTVENITLSHINMETDNDVDGFINENNGGRIKEVLMSSITIKAINNANGFANKNAGIIDSCIIRSSNPSSSAYQDVSLYGNIVAGFVNQNTGTIQNSYVVGTLTAEDKVVGFVALNGDNSKIDSCYVNGLMTANNIASGFVLSDNKGSILNSFVVGDIKVIEEEGYASGFVYQQSSPYVGTYSNNYVALWNLSATNVYKFGFVHSGTNVNDCFWLADTKVVGSEVQEPGGDSWNTYLTKAKELSYEEMVQKGQTSQPFTTYPYYSGIEGTDSTTTEYPFFLTSTSDAYTKVEFWGDWTMKKSTTENLQESVEPVFFDRKKTDSQ